MNSINGGYTLPSFKLNSISTGENSCGKNSLAFLGLFYKEIIASNFDEGGSSPEALKLFLEISFGDARLPGRPYFDKNFVFRESLKPGSPFTILVKEDEALLLEREELKYKEKDNSLENVTKFGWSGIGVQDPYMYKSRKIEGHFVGFIRDPRSGPNEGRLLYFYPQDCAARKVNDDDFVYETRTGENWKKLQFDSVLWIKKRIYGSRATVKGLLSKPELNGQIIMIVEYSTKTDRYTVEFDDKTKMNIKSINLT